MPTKTKIEWADYVSNPLKAAYQTPPMPLLNEHSITRKGFACVKVSEGCANCWASAMNVRLGTGLAYTRPNIEKVAFEWNDAEMVRAENFSHKGPFKNGRSRPILFIHDMTDIFGDWVDAEYQKRTWGIMEWRTDIDFVVLTKRPGNMLSFVAGSAPLPNVILGTSVENQKRADERADALTSLHHRGWRTMVSYEPALGPVNWDAYWFLDWLICGGESGHSARPMCPDWAMSAMHHCEEYDIPFFFKQWGEWAAVYDLVDRGMTTFKHPPVDVDGTMMARVGKGLAGHLLYGKEWRQTP
jgi:protein gp37